MTTDNTPMGKDQDHRSNALALAGLGVLLGMNILAFVLHIWPSVIWIAVSVIGTAYFAFENFKNTVEDNEAWKSYGAMIMILVVAAIYASPIGTHAINQP